jgi:hypothetical protein
MKLPLSVALALLLLNCAIAQNENEFDRRNGFKGIKMASHIDSIKGAKFKKEFKEKGSHEAALYVIDHPDYQKIGEVKVNQIEAKTFKGFIYEILVITEKDPRLMKGMEAVLGSPVYNIRDETYQWSGKKGWLKFKTHSKNELELLYHSHAVIQMMKDDKAQKIKDISSDF